MNKSQKIKTATRNTRVNNIKQWLKKVILYPWDICKKIWRFVVRILTAIWNWLKSIDIVGMVNMTLLVAIIVLFSSLILNFTKSDSNKDNLVAKSNTVSIAKTSKSGTRDVIQRMPIRQTLPLKASVKTGIKPQIKTIGVKKPVIVKAVSVPAESLPKQNFSGDIIVDTYPSAPVLSNGVKIEGNLFIQNMRKYTLPCDAKIRGNLFVRNVEKLSFCGKFTVQGNIYVSPRSSFGPIPSNARIDGNVIL